MAVMTEPDFLNFKKSNNMNFTGKYDFPECKPIQLKHPEEVILLGFNYATNPNVVDKDKKWVHFFLPDYRFQQVWNKPRLYVNKFSQFKGICSPDFSCYVGMPKALQIFNVYRAAFLTAYYQNYGIDVIPSVTWGEPDTYSFCFDWIPKGSAIVCSSVGCMMNSDSIKRFLQGYEKMLEIVEPSSVILYGKTTPEMVELYPDLYRVPSQMELRREKISQVHQWEGKR